MRNKWLYLVILVAVALLSSPSPLLSQAVVGQIAFVSDRDGNREIYLINAEGTDLTNLTNHPAEDYYPAWSPDGQQLAFVSDRSGTGQIYIMAADGSDVRQLTDVMGNVGKPVWAPDGSKIAFKSQIGFSDQVDIYWLNIDGSGLTQVYSQSGFGGRISWSPNGQQLLFDNNPDDNFDLFLVNLDGSGLHTFASGVIAGGPTHGKPSWEFGPAWSPDGQLIAFNSTRLEGRLDVYIANLDGSGLRNLTPHVNYAFGPVWSPDGRRLAFMSAGEGIYVAEVGSEQLTRLSELSHSGTDADWSWSPDGRYLAFATGSGHNFNIYVVAHDGSEQTVLISHPAHNADPVWRPVPPPVPPAGYIAYLGHDGNVWLIMADGSEQQQLTNDAARHRTAAGGVNYCCLVWSPNGQMLAFERSILGNGYQEHLLVYSLLDDQVRELVADSLLLGFDWSTDSSALVYARSIPEAYWDRGEREMVTVQGLWQVNVTSGAHVELVPPEGDRPLAVPNWSPDGRYLGFIEAEFYEGPQPFAIYDFTTDSYVSWGEAIGLFDWAPNGEFIVYDSTYYGESIGITRADPFGGSQRSLTSLSPPTVDIGPLVSPTGNHIVFQRFSGEDSPSQIWVMASDGSEAKVLGSYSNTLDFGGPVVYSGYSWSPDGEWLVVVSGMSLAVLNATPEIYLVHRQTGQSVMLVGGAWAVWQPIPLQTDTVDVTPWLEEKQVLIRQLGEMDIPTTLFTIPGVVAYDETAARDLYSRIAAQLDQGTLTAEQSDAFARLTLQERALAQALPEYTGVAATIADTSASTIETALGVIFVLRPGWNRCQETIPFCGRLQQATERTVWRLLNNGGQLVIRLVGDEPDQRETGVKFWDLTVRLTEDQLAQGHALQDLLVDTAIQAAGTYILIQPYLHRTQGLLDKGVATADLDNVVADPLPLTGTTERAELLISSLVDQAAIEKEAAVERHQDFQQAVNILEFAEDIADIATLSPMAFIAEAVGLGARLEHLVVNLGLTLWNFHNLECVGYLGQRAAMVTFDATQPFDSCRERAALLFSPVGTESPTAPQLVSTNTPLQAKLRDEAEQYRTTVRLLLQALKTEDLAVIEEVIVQLEQTEASLEIQLDKAQAIVLAGETFSQEELRLWKQRSAFTAGSFALYLAVTETLLAGQSGLEPEADLDQVAEAVLVAINEIETTLEGIDLLPPADTPLLVVGNIQAEIVAGQMQVSIGVSNVGTAAAGETSVLLLVNEEVAAVTMIETIPSGQEVKVILVEPLPEANSLNVQVWVQDMLVDSRWHGVDPALAELPQEEAPVFDEEQADVAMDSVDEAGAIEAMNGSDPLNWLPIAAGVSGVLLGFILVAGGGLRLWRRASLARQTSKIAGSFCIHCRAEYPPTGKFCIKCGQKRDQI